MRERERGDEFEISSLGEAEADADDETRPDKQVTKLPSIGLGRHSIACVLWVLDWVGIA
jgi:hypothetical protein